MLQARLYVLGAIGLVVIASAAYGGRVLYRAGFNAALLAQKTNEQLIQEAARAVESSTAQAISNITVKHVTIRQNLEKELTRDVVYRDCVAAPRVFELTNEAITGRSDTASDGVLPASEPTPER